jgi:hypothetical protein
MRMEIGFNYYLLYYSHKQANSLIIYRGSIDEQIYQKYLENINDRYDWSNIIRLSHKLT